MCLHILLLNDTLVLETLQSIQATRIIEQEQVVRLILCHSVIEEGRREKCDEGSIFAVKDASDDDECYTLASVVLAV